MQIHFTLSNAFIKHSKTNKLPYFLILILYLPLWSCSNEENTNDDTVDLTKIIIPPKVNATYETLFDSTFFIPLETNSECIIKKIDYIDSMSNSIYILDIGGRQILKFGFDGRFLGKYSKIGASESEFYTPVDFTILHNQKEICLYDPGNDKLLYFDDSLNFLREKKVPFRFKKFTINSNGASYLFDKEYSIEEDKRMKYQILKTDSAFNIKSRQIPYKTELGFFLAGADGNGTITKDYHKNLYLPFYSPIIFQIDTVEKCTAKYMINFEKGKLLSEKTAEKLTAMNYTKVLQDTNTITGVAITNNQNNLVGFYRIANSYFHFTYNFNTQKVKLLQAKTNPACGCGPIYTFKRFFESYLAGYVTSANFEGFVTELNFTKKDSASNKLNELKVSSSNNPVLVFSKLREQNIVAVTE
ncbi:6-bladed beta-propeller [Niabella aquatica]